MGLPRWERRGQQKSRHYWRAECSVGRWVATEFRKGLLFGSSRSFYTRPHRSELSIGNNSCHIEFNSISFDPRTEVSPDFPNVTGLCNSNTTSTDRFTDSALQFKPFELVSRGTRINVVSETRTRLPSTFNGREAPNNQIVLQKRQSRIYFL